MANSLTQTSADLPIGRTEGVRRVGQKAVAALLLAVGGMLWIAATLGLIAAMIYFNVAFVKALFHGDVLAAFIGIPVANGIAILVLSLLQMPGALLLAAAEAIRPSREP